MQGISGDAATGSMQGGDSRKRGRQIEPLWGALDREVGRGEKSKLLRVDFTQKERICYHSSALGNEGKVAAGPG